jgi:hypothetical protein
MVATNLTLNVAVELSTPNATLSAAARWCSGCSGCCHGPLALMAQRRCIKMMAQIHRRRIIIMAAALPDAAD